MKKEGKEKEIGQYKRWYIVYHLYKIPYSLLNIFLYNIQEQNCTFMYSKNLGTMYDSLSIYKSIQKVSVFQSIYNVSIYLNI